jgi:hypothetical protein
MKTATFVAWSGSKHSLKCKGTLPRCSAPAGQASTECANTLDRRQALTLDIKQAPQAALRLRLDGERDPGVDLQHRALVAHEGLAQVERGGEAVAGAS